MKKVKTEEKREREKRKKKNRRIKSGVKDRTCSKQQGLQGPLLNFNLEVDISIRLTYITPQPQEGEKKGNASR